MTNHPNAALVARGYEAFAKGDIKTIDDLMADEVVWHQPGNAPISGDYRGKEGVHDFFRKLAETTGGTFKAQVEDILADDERAVVIQHSTAQRAGKKLDLRETLVYEIKNGKLTEVQLYMSDPERETEFWS